MTKLFIRSVSFGSEGPPHDEGLPIGKSIIEEWGRCCLDGGADTYEYYTPSMLDTDADRWSVKRWGDEHTMPQNQSYHKIGLGAWRSVIFRKTMDKAKDGDVIVVHCSNFPKVPQMKYFAANLRRYVEKVLTFTDFFMPPHDIVGNYTTHDVINLIPEVWNRDHIAKAPMGRARLIIAKVTPQTREFARTFENTLKENPELLSGFNKQPWPGVRFGHSTAEQSVINVLAYRDRLFPVTWEGTWMSKFRQIGWELGTGVDSVLAF